MKVVIIGPTGVGKTKLSIALAKWLNASVINADAVQIYKELNIGSAKVREDEKDGVEHLLFDIKAPNEEYSVKEYQDDVRNIFNQNANKNFVMVGGTGLYVCGSLMDYRFEEDTLEDYSSYDLDELYEMALKKDANCNIAKNNRIRIERFLKRKTTQLVEPKILYDDVVLIGLTTDREKLYDIINNRVDVMINDGLLEEARELYEKYPNSKILKRAIGYKELIEYFKGNISLEEAIDLIKKNSRHYAKRQYTWFNNKMNVNWFDVNYNDFDKTINQVKEFIEKRLK